MAEPGRPSPGASGDPTAAGDDELDWFGYPVERPRDPVPCPRCDRTFTDRAAYTAHVTEDHGLAATPVHGGRRAEQPALGKSPRGTWSRRMRTVPLVVVLAANVALVLAVLGGMAAVGPEWWDEMMGESWSLVVLIPLLWPTILFLAIRGMD